MRTGRRVAYLQEFIKMFMNGEWEGFSKETVMTWPFPYTIPACFGGTEVNLEKSNDIIIFSCRHQGCLLEGWQHCVNMSVALRVTLFGARPSGSESKASLIPWFQGELPPFWWRVNF